MSPTDSPRPAPAPIPSDIRSVLYGRPPADLVEIGADAVQLSPLVPGSQAIEAIADASVDHAVILAPPGTIERRYVLAQGLRILRPGGRMTALAQKDKGGSRIAGELETFGCDAAGESRRHFRILETTRPAAPPASLPEAINAGAPFVSPALGLWTQPGIFAFDRIDPGTRLLIERLPRLSGDGADLGCGIGPIGRAALAMPKVSSLAFVDLDRRAVDAARRNVDDPRASFVWGDLREPLPGLADLDFVLSNPPFHDAGAEDRLLGQTICKRAAGLLRRGGLAVIVANRHLPYEGVLGESFARVETLAESGGYKLFEARK